MSKSRSNMTANIKKEKCMKKLLCALLALTLLLTCGCAPTPAETTAPDEKEPETTLPEETTAPEVTVPEETTAPETTEPETTAPETTAAPVYNAPVVLSPKAETRPVVVHKTLPRTTLLNLDLKSPVTYQNIYGTSTTIDP